MAQMETEDTQQQGEEPGDNNDSNNASTYLWKNTRVVGIILVYCAIGSQLSVVNKVVVTFIPLPNTILFFQFFATTVMLLVAHSTGAIEVEPLTWEITGIFTPLVITFFALLYAGMEVMKYAPLETFITVKSMTPVLFCVCEYLFLGRSFHSPIGSTHSHSSHPPPTVVVTMPPPFNHSTRAVCFTKCASRHATTHRCTLHRM